MTTTKIKVTDYYGNPSYYSVMPRAIFDALELASLKGEDLAEVERDQLEKMITEYELKMA